MPAWQAVVPQLVPKDDLPPAIAANSVGVNISRALGPALGGVTISAYRHCRAVLDQCRRPISAIVGALIMVAPGARTRTLLPAERFGQPMLAGLRYARHNQHLRATLVRAAGFFLFASAYWALLPLVARQQMRGGPETLRRAARRHRRRRRGRRIFPAVAESKARTGSADGAWRARPSRWPWCFTALPASRRRRLLASAMAGASWIAALATLERIRAGRVAGLGARARAWRSTRRCSSAA